MPKKHVFELTFSYFLWISAANWLFVKWVKLKCRQFSKSTTDMYLSEEKKCSKLQSVLTVLHSKYRQGKINLQSLWTEFQEQSFGNLPFSIEKYFVRYNKLIIQASLFRHRCEEMRFRNTYWLRFKCFTWQSRKFSDNTDTKN